MEHNFTMHILFKRIGIVYLLLVISNIIFIQCVRIDGELAQWMNIVKKESRAVTNNLDTLQSNADDVNSRLTTSFEQLNSMMTEIGK